MTAWVAQRKEMVGTALSNAKRREGKMQYIVSGVEETIKLLHAQQFRHKMLLSLLEQ
jgi:hypothetical protein